MENLVVAISSSALFDVTEEDRIYKTEGVEAYQAYCKVHKDEPLKPGPAFSLVKKLLSLNGLMNDDGVCIEIVILSRNSAQTGKRVFDSATHYGLAIERGVFTDGHNPRRFARSFGASLFLSTNMSDVQKCLSDGIPAGCVVGGYNEGNDEGPLLLAFDFDGIIADDESERVFKKQGLENFFEHEKAKKDQVHEPGPLVGLLLKLSEVRDLDVKRSSGQKHQRRLRLALVTARSNGAHNRVQTTLDEYGVGMDISAFMAGEKKSKVLTEMKPDVFFDDQSSHLTGCGSSAMVHVPYGIANLKS